MTSEEFIDRIKEMCNKHSYKTNTIGTLYHIRKNNIANLLNDIMDLVIYTDCSWYRTSRYSTNLTIFRPKLSDDNDIALVFNSHGFELRDTDMLYGYGILQVYFKGWIKDYKNIYVELPEHQQCWLMLKGAL